MCGRYTLLAVSLMFAGPAHTLWAQQDDAVIAVNAVSVRATEASELTQLDLYTRISHSQLNFVSGPTGFTAQYRVSVEIIAIDERDRPTLIVQSPIWDRIITVPIFAQTVSTTQRDVTTHAVLLAPGKYLVSFEITDQNGGETWLRELVVDVRDLDRPLAISDVVLLDAYDRSTRTTHPRVSNFLSGNALSFEVYFEVYSDRPRTVTLTRELVPLRPDPVRYGAAGMQPDRKAVFSDTSWIALNEELHQVVLPFPAPDLGVGAYTLRVRVQDADHTDMSEQVVVSQWTGLSLHLADLDQAIDQMIYAASRRELQNILSGATEAERRRRFDEFWKARDPTPETDRNERMEQYYYRVSVATRRFSSVRPGWQTDRGHVLILHGNPEDTHRQTFSFNAEPYEIWYYYRLGRQYVFVDATGFGDYELLVPIWDESTRMR